MLLIPVVDETLPEVSADAGLIERVLDNLIDNSLKHTPDRGQICLRVAARGADVEIAVSDTGYGIADDELPQVLERFYRKPGHESGDDERPGLGLGLAITSRIVEMHGSHLSVDSVVHQGTTFRFSLSVAAWPDRHPCGAPPGRSGASRCRAYWRAGFDR